MSRNFLPEEFQFSHDFCLFLHDQLVGTIKSGEEAKIFAHRWEIEAGKPVPPQSLSGEELFSWFERNGYEDVVKILYYKQIYAALLSDMVHFIYEALSCSRKGKLTVSYALLRKPLKENLFYLEWLLADPKGMLMAFDSEDVEARVIDKAFSDERKKEIIKRAVEKTRHGEWIDSDLIYDLRYNKNFHAGFEVLFQKANHLVTSFRFLRTEKANFNFVFSDPDAMHSQWRELYSFLPVFLLHTVQVSEAIISGFAKRKPGIDLTEIRTAIGMSFWLERGPHAAGPNKIRTEIRRNLKKADLGCPDCKLPLSLSDEAFLILYQNNEMACDKCGWKMDISKLSGDL